MTTKNPDFSLKLDISLHTFGNTEDTDYISFNNNDDNDELNKKIVNFNKMDTLFITDDINKTIIDSKINKELQDKKFISYKQLKRIKNFVRKHLVGKIKDVIFNFF